MIGDPRGPRASQVDVAVVGAGQAGLASAYFLRRAGLAPHTGYVVLDGGQRPGGAWQHRWPSLRLDTVHRLYDLPGLALPEVDGARPASEVVSDYFAAYERTLRLPVLRPVPVTAVQDDTEGRLAVRTPVGTWSARAVISATGTWGRPFRPYYPGIASFRGRQLHTADYRSAAEFRGQHVVVIGGGTSAVQLLTEIAEVTTTTWVTRREPVFRDGTFTAEDGRAAVALVEAAVREGRPPASVVSVTGLLRTPAVREARSRGVLRREPMFDRVTPTGVAWDDGRHVDADVLLWCTGFRPDLAHLAPLHLREPGGGIRLLGTRVAADPRVHLVGYGPSASTVGAGRAARSAVREIRELLATEAALAA